MSLPTTEAAAPPPPGDAPIAPTISVPGPLVVIPAAPAPRRFGIERAGNEHVNAGHAGRCTGPRTPSSPEPPRSTDITPPEATGASSESNRDQLRPQKPLDVTSLDSDPSGPGQQAAGGVGPGQTAPAANPAAPRQVQRSRQSAPRSVGETESTIPQAHPALIEAGAEAVERRQIARPGRAPARSASDGRDGPNPTAHVG